jgi:hypothetical protein
MRKGLDQRMVMGAKKIYSEKFLRYDLEIEFMPKQGFLGLKMRGFAH